MYATFLMLKDKINDKLRFFTSEGFYNLNNWNTFIRREINVYKNKDQELI